MKEEIKLVHVHIETPLLINENFPQLLIVENPAEFYRFVSDLDRQMEGLEGEFVFSCNGNIISAEKYGAMVCDPFHFELNDKKILNLLYKYLERNSFGENLSYFNRLTAQTVSFLEELAFAVPFSLSYDEPQPIDYFKAADVKFEKTYESLEEKLLCYINALIELKKCEFFIFVNLKSVLDDKKLLHLYNHCQAEKVGVLLITNSRVRPLLPCEKAIIITEDLCEILENYWD